MQYNRFSYIYGMPYCSSECGSISIMQLRTIYCITYGYIFHVCLCLLALTFVSNSIYLLKLAHFKDIWFKTAWCSYLLEALSNGAMILATCNAIHALKRCKLVTTVWSWYVKNILANFDGNVYSSLILHASTKSRICVASCQQNCTVWHGL